MSPSITRKGAALGKALAAVRRIRTDSGVLLGVVVTVVDTTWAVVGEVVAPVTGS